MERKTRKGFRDGRRGRVGATVLTVAAIAAALANVAPGAAWGQISTASEKKGAGSLLDSTQPNGRFSGERYDGALKPTAKPESSRFASDAARGSAGNVVGIDANRAGGRYVGASSFQSKQNFELFAWRNEFLRTKNALKQAERALGGASGKQDGPRLTTAKEPKPIALSEWRRGVRYGRTQDEIAAARQAELAAQANVGSGNVANPIDPATSPLDAWDPATIWMRGRAPISDWTQTPFDLRLEQGGVASAPGGGWVELDGRLRSELAGASLAPSGAPFASAPELLPGRSAEEKRVSYQEYLTTRLLETPAVNPLSPISVEFRDGVATVRGIVPTPSARQAAGNVLLAEPDVRRVENQLTCVRSDDSGPGAIVPVAPTPGASNNAAPTDAASPGNAPLIPILPDVGTGAPFSL
jgi:hypothetical protein